MFNVQIWHRSAAYDQSVGILEPQPLISEAESDCHPLGNGRKPTLRACSEDDADSSARISNYSASFAANTLRARSGSEAARSGSEAAVLSDAPSTSASAVAPRVHNDINGACSVAGTVLLSGWGHKKRSRGSREGRQAADESQGTRSRKLIKIQRRNATAGGGGEKLTAASAMPPPGASYTRGANLRPCTPVRDSLAPLVNRTVEERSSGQHRLEKRSPPSPPEKSNSTADASLSAAVEVVKPKSDHEKAVNGCEKKNTEPFEWPRIYLSLSRKEKEDDFLAMKGTKLPQRPKKRAKNVDKTLQYCFPGMWLSDLTRGRYEVREKKCVKKKRRGLKGMESMESDSE